MFSQLLANGLVAGFAIALLAVGFSIQYSAVRFFVFTFGACHVWAAYAMSFARQHVPITFAALFGVLVGIAVGLLLEIGIYRVIRRQKENALVLMLASIGAYVVLQNGISILFGDTTLTVRGWETAPGYMLGGARITLIQLLIASVSLAAVLVVWMTLQFTLSGRCLRAVADDPMLARTVGISVERTILWATAVGSAMSSLAGVLVGIDTGLIPTMGFDALLWAIVATVVGGVNSVKGAIVGGLLVGLALHLGVLSIGTEWQNAALFVILLLFLFFRPQGVLGKQLRTAAV